MENSENASQKNSAVQQPNAGRTNETSVKKLIPLKGLKKINPALLKNVKDAMISAVAKSKSVKPDEKTTTKTENSPKLPKKDTKVKILSVENPHLNVKDLFPGLTLPEDPKDKNEEKSTVSTSEEKAPKPVRGGASDAVKLALAKKLANKKLVAAAIKNKPPVRKPKVEKIVDNAGSDMEIDNTIPAPCVLELPGPSQIVYATQSTLTPSKIDISSIPVIIDDGNLPPLIVVPPAENFQPSYVLPTISTPSSVKRKISFSHESPLSKQPGVVQKFLSSPVKVEKDPDPVDYGKYTVHRGNSVQRSPSSNIRVPFEIHGDTRRRICLTKITTANDPLLKQNVLQGCRKLVKSTSTPFVKIKDEKDSDDELHGFTSAEIEASKRVSLDYLKHNSEGSVKEVEKKAKPKVVANIKTMLKNSSLHEKLKQAVEANRKSNSEHSKEPDKEKIVEKSGKSKTKQTEINNCVVKKTLELPINNDKIFVLTNSTVEEPKIIKRVIERSRKVSEVKESPRKRESKETKVINVPIESPQKRSKSHESTRKREKSLSEETKVKNTHDESPQKRSEAYESPNKVEKPSIIASPVEILIPVVENLKSDMTPKSPNVKSSLLDIREKLSQSLGSSSSPSSSNPDISSILELLKQDSLLNDFVKFAKEKMVKTRSSNDNAPNSDQNDSLPKVSVEKSSVVPEKRSSFTCGNCKATVDHWDDHLLHHNGLAWRLDVDTPIDLCNERTKLNIVTQFQANNFIPNLKCEICGQFLSTSLGLLNHMKKCGMTPDEIEKDKKPCEHCGNLLMSVSMASHLKSHCKALRKKQEEEKEREKSQIEQKSISDDDSRGFEDNRCSSPEIEETVGEISKEEVGKVDLSEEKKLEEKNLTETPAKSTKEESPLIPSSVPEPENVPILAPEPTKPLSSSQRSLSMNRNSLPKMLKPKKKFTPLIPKPRLKGILTKSLNKDSKVESDKAATVDDTQKISPESSKNDPIEDFTAKETVVASPVKEVTTENVKEIPLIEVPKEPDTNEKLLARRGNKNSDSISVPIHERRKSCLKISIQSPKKPENDESPVIVNEDQNLTQKKRRSILKSPVKELPPVTDSNNSIEQSLKAVTSPKKVETPKKVSINAENSIENNTKTEEKPLEEPKLELNRRKSKSHEPMNIPSTSNLTENPLEKSPKKERRKSRLLTLPESDFTSNVTDFDSSMAEFMTTNNVVTDQNDLKIAENPESNDLPAVENESPAENVPDKPISVEEVIVELLVSETPVSKKRGRPKKSLNVIEANSPKPGSSTESDFPVEFGLLRRKAATQADQKRRSKLPIEQPTSPASSDREVFEELHSETKVRGKRGRKRKTEETPKNVVDDSNSDDEAPLSTLKSKRKLPETSTPVPKKHKADTDYTCSACNQFITRKKWLKHLIQHNGLAWRIELDPAIDLDNENVKLNTMIRFQKERRIPILKCEKCGEQKKSALGLIGHLKKCGLAPEDLDKAKIACVHCGSLCMSYSMPIHVRNHCRVLKEREAAERQKERAEIVVEGGNEPEFNDSGRIKRRAVKKAEALLKGETGLDFNPDQFIITKKKHKINSRTITKWQKILEDGDLIGCYHTTDCPIQSKSIEEATHHQETCKFANLIYCAACSFRSNHHNEVFDHVKASHGPGDERKFFDDEDSDAYEAKSQKSDSDSDSFEGEEESDIETPSEGEFTDRDNTQKANRRRRIEDQRHLARSNDIGTNPKYQMLRYMTFKELSQFKSAAELLVEFYKENYSDHLYHELKPFKPWKILSTDEKVNYEPINRTSMKYFVQTSAKYSPDPISINVKDDQWKCLSLYQSITTDSSTNMYVGGSVTSMQWLPFPDSYTGPQILAVTSKRDPNKFMTYSNSVPETSFIQLWSFEKPSKSKLTEKMMHLYSIAIDSGPIWDMKVCPSGGYCENDRLGLLACTSISGKICIYALPGDIKKCTSGAIMIKLQPCMTLDSGASNTFGCKISWSRSKNHSLLAAGFSNGNIAIWKLDTSSPLLRKNSSDGVSLVPIHSFVAHQEAITSLVFHHSSNADYLLTGSQDRRLKVFQLNNDTKTEEFFNLKCLSRVSCVDWPANWIAFFYGVDCDFSFQRSELKLKNPNELGPLLDYGSMCNISSSITDVVVNEWTDVVYYGTVAGEVLACYRPNYLLTTGTEKTIERFVYSFTQLCPISGSEEQGIIFSDLNNKSSIVEKKTVCQATRKEDISRLPCEKVSKIVINPNKSYSKYYAVGYECGFVRIKKNPTSE